MRNIKITKFLNQELRFIGSYSRDNVPRIIYGLHIINLDDKKSKGPCWVSLFIDRNTAVYFDSFGIEYYHQEVSNEIKDKSITHNIFRTQSDDYNMCGFYCITFIEYMIAEKFLLDYIDFFLLTTIKERQDNI